MNNSDWRRGVWLLGPTSLHPVLSLRRPRRNCVRENDAKLRMSLDGKFLLSDVSCFLKVGAASRAALRAYSPDHECPSRDPRLFSASTPKVRLGSADLLCARLKLYHA